MRILLIDKFSDRVLVPLRAAGHEVAYLPGLSREAVLAELATAEVLVINSHIRVDAEALAAAPNLRLIVRAGVGLDHIAVDLAQQRGIRVVATPGANADAVAEHTLGMLLMLRHNLARANAEVRQMIWKREENRGSEILAKTVAVIGFGHTGTAVTRRLLGMGCRVLIHDPFVDVATKLRQQPWFMAGYHEAQAADWSQICAEASILTLHVPLTSDTRHLIDNERIAAFQQPFVLLNLARGEVVDLAAVADALDSGKLIGAALDVLENEKLQTLTEMQQAVYQRLFARDNVLLAPHIGGWTHESLQNIEAQVVAACLNS